MVGRAYPEDFVLTNSRSTVSNWLYQFWLFSFSTAKYWGRGPRHWTSDLLDFNAYSSLSAGPATPSGAHQGSPGLSTGQLVEPHKQDNPQVPDPLCRWSVHTERVADDNLQEASEGDTDNMDIDEIAGMQPWPQDWHQPSIQDRLRMGLVQNHFSSVRSSDLPMAISQVLRTTARSEEDLLLESISFAIIGRNLELLEDLLDKAHRLKFDYSRIYPLHLATAYLDGSKMCCNLVDRICLGLTLNQPRETWTN